jgi:O-antigen ligase
MQKEKYFFYSLCIVALFIPFDVKITNTLIIAATALWLLSVRRYFKSDWKTLLPYFLLFAGLYLINFPGLILTDNMSSGLGRLESRLSYLFFPLIILFSNLSKNDFRKIGYSFCTGVTLAGLYCLGNALQIYFATPLDNRSFSQLSYLELLISLDLHPTYFSLFLSFSIFFLIFDWYEHREAMRRWWPIWLWVGYLLVYNFLVQSRAPLAAFLLIALVVMIGFLMNLKTYRKQILVIMTIVVAGAAWVAVGNETVSNRFNLQLHKIPDLVLQPDTAISEGASTQSTIYHLRSWYCATNLLKDVHFFTGYGSGDEKDLLQPCYTMHGWTVMASERMNAHNEYLSALLRNGILELILVLACLLYPLYLSIRHGHYLYMTFLMLWLAIYFFNTLNLQSAIFFYALFNALLFRQMFPDIRNTK